MTDFGGMTVNERLFVAGEIDQWDAAIVAGNREDAIAVLTRVGITALDAALTVDTTMAHRASYGFPPSRAN